MKLSRIDPYTYKYVEVDLPDEFSEEYRRRFELVQSKMSDVQRTYSGVRLDGLLLAQIAYRLSRECGFPVVVSICFGRENNQELSSIAAYPVPSP